MMRAIVVERFVNSYRELKPSSVPTPTPGPDEVLVDISHAGLNYVDLLYCRGKHQNNRRHVKPPFILGLEFAGTVVSAPTSSALRRGDRVFGGAGTGAFAQTVAVRESLLRRVPDGWSLEDAAGMAATAPVSYGALVRVAEVKSGEVVLVHAAAGGLGCMAVQIAKALGAKVIATVGSEAKRRVSLGLGADHAVRYDQEGWEREVLGLTGGQGVDVTFDSVGLIEQSIRCSKYRAIVLIVGFAGREGNLEKVAANRVLLKSIRLVGYRYGEHGRRFPNETLAVWNGLNELLDQKLIKPVIYREPYQGLGAVPQAMEDMAARKIWGKAVIQIDSMKNPVKL